MTNETKIQYMQRAAVGFMGMGVGAAVGALLVLVVGRWREP